MAIVATGVHLALIARVMRKFVHLGQRQRVHVGTQADHACGGAGPQDTNNAGFGDAAMDLKPIALKFCSDQISRAIFVKGQFRMGVNVAADRRDPRA